MLRYACLLCLIAVMLVSCGTQEAHPRSPHDQEAVSVAGSGQAEIRSSAADAVYFAASEGGEIDPADLQRYPELAVVRSFADLQAAADSKNAIWIDKNVADQVEHAWLSEQSRLKKTIVVVGYSDSLYAFREALDAFGIKGPYVDWSRKRVSPGFSVWKLKTQTSTKKSAWLRGYEQPSTVDSIVAATAPFQEAETPIERPDR